ncbi:MAG: purine-binding chemotaxis protein CheW [Desulfobulbaceae bacterium]|nr:purine-binding chemotaxis protein CheW [Desulfobulbaceae bacterium]
MTEVMSISESSIQNIAGKYLTFALANEDYGLEILKVREIIGYIEVTSVPQTSEYVLGVINLRGQVIPVVNLRSKFDMELIDTTEESCIIVVEVEQDGLSISAGILVDRVQEVLDITSDTIEPPPDFGSTVSSNYILGMGKIGKSVKILLDIDKVLSSDEISQLGSLEVDDTANE